MSKKPNFNIEMFEGRPTFCMEKARYNENGKEVVKYLRLGIRSAKKILQIIPEIKNFIKENDNVKKDITETEKR